MEQSLVTLSSLLGPVLGFYDPYLKPGLSARDLYDPSFEDIAARYADDSYDDLELLACEADHSYDNFGLLAREVDLDDSGFSPYLLMRDSN